MRRPDNSAVAADKQKDSDGSCIAEFHQARFSIAGESAEKHQKSAGDDETCRRREKRRHSFNGEANREVGRSPDEINHGKRQPNSRCGSAVCMWADDLIQGAAL